MASVHLKMGLMQCSMLYLPLFFPTLAQSASWRNRDIFLNFLSLLESWIPQFPPGTTSVSTFHFASGVEESRTENGVLLYGWPKDPQNPQYAQIRRESREALETPRLRGSRAPVLPALCDPAAVNLLLEMGPFPGTPPVLQGPMAPSPHFLHRG